MKYTNHKAEHHTENLSLYQMDDKYFEIAKDRIEAETRQLTLFQGINKMSKYNRDCKGIKIDVYDVLIAFEVTNPAIAHGVKKLLAGGERGYKDVEQDYNEAIASIKRGIELECNSDKINEVGK